MKNKNKKKKIRKKKECIHFSVFDCNKGLMVCQKCGKEYI
jgi:hypothetical protein